MMRRYLFATLTTAALAIATAAVPAGQPSQASCASLLSARLPDRHHPARFPNRKRLA